jgi:microcystin degradation protein MlrC
MRVAVAGLQHETNRFVCGVTGAEAFAAPGAWPPLTRGAARVETLAGTSVPTAGALGVFAEAGVEVVSLFQAMALPAATG